MLFLSSLDKLLLDADIDNFKIEHKKGNLGVGLAVPLKDMNILSCWANNLYF